jgi:hypothetical protein
MGRLTLNPQNQVRPVEMIDKSSANFFRCQPSAVDAHLDLAIARQARIAAIVSLITTTGSDVSGFSSVMPRPPAENREARVSMLGVNGDRKPCGHGFVWVGVQPNSAIDSQRHR